MASAIESSATAGAAYLDEKVPGWARMIDVDRLDQRWGGFAPSPSIECGCVGSQLDAAQAGGDTMGSYGRFCADQHLTDAQTIGYGFQLPEGEWRRSIDDRCVWRELTDAWKLEIEFRVKGE